MFSSIFDDSGGIIDNSRVTLQLVASLTIQFTIVIFFKVQATGVDPVGNLPMRVGMSCRENCLNF